MTTGLRISVSKSVGDLVSGAASRLWLCHCVSEPEGADCCQQIGFGLRLCKVEIKLITASSTRRIILVVLFFCQYCTIPTLFIKQLS